MKAWGARVERRRRASVVLPLQDGPERARSRVLDGIFVNGGYGMV